MDDDKEPEIVEIIEKTKRICRLLNSRIGDNIMLDKLLRIWRKKHQQTSQKLKIKQNFEQILQKSSEKAILEENEENDDRKTNTTEHAKFLSIDEKNPIYLNKNLSLTESEKKRNLNEPDEADADLEKTPSMTRSFSLPYLSREDSNEKNKMRRTILPLKDKKSDIRRLHSIEQIFEEKFIYYFESFVDQFLDIKFEDKNKVKNKFRNRLYSSGFND